MALSARAWIGKSTPSVLLGAVSLLPSPPSAATPRSATNGIAVGCRPDFGMFRRPGPELAESTGVTGANEEHVALADGDALLELGGLELVAEDVLARLEPGHSPETGDIEQDASSDQAVREDLDRIGLGASGRHGPRPESRCTGSPRR